MKPIKIVLLLVVACVGVIGCQKKKADIVNEMYPEEQKQIDKIVHDIFDAAEKKDVDRLKSFHLVGPKFTKCDDSDPLTRQDAQGAMKSERDGFAGVTDFNINIQDLKADVFGDVAIATFIADYQIKVGETTTAARARSTLVFVKAGDAWKVTHEHISAFKSNP